MTANTLIRKILISAALVLSLGLYTWRGAPLKADQDARQRNLLVIGVGRDFYDGPDSRTYLHGSTNTWEALTRLDENLRARPWLAESWQSTDNDRTWVFHLRQDVRFHDGSLMTASDVAVNLERMRRHARCDPSGIFRNVVSIEVRGENDVAIRLKVPSPAFPNHIAYYSSPVLKPSCFDKDGRISQLVATGPYRLDRIQRGQTVELSPFADYRQGKPEFRKVVFKTILDAQARTMALATGEIDAIADVGGILPEQAAEITALSGVVLKQQEVATTHYLFFNMRQSFFSQPESRLWLASAIDLNELVQSLAGESGRLALDYYSPLARDWVFGDLGFKAGKKPDPSDRKVIILLNSGTIQRWPYLEMAQVIQEKLQAEGFNAGIVVQETGGWQQALKSGAWDLAMQPNTLMTGDPDFFFSYYIASGAPGNFGYLNPEMDRSIQSARIEGNFSRRQELYHRICDRMNQDLPVLPLYHDVCLYAHRDHLAHFEMDPNFRVRLDRVRTKEKE
ncbi:MAG: ABC transporter substrate-binding protein [Deltaproteobacteria bacterium]|nr:ABC transporter substrate-binding protein [Deltaproteobacteria bacterium]